MPKNFKPGWEYIYSNMLNREVAVNIKMGKAYCEDGTIYSLEELKIMDNAKQEITPGVHLVKKIFGGEITEFIHKETRNGQF
jgi:phage gp36-like protein